MTQKTEVSIVDVESKVCVVAVKRDDFPLRVGCHPLEQDAFVVFQGSDAVLLRLPGKLHLTGSDRKWALHKLMFCFITVSSI